MIRFLVAIAFLSSCGYGVVDAPAEQEIVQEPEVVVDGLTMLKSDVSYDIGLIHVMVSDISERVQGLDLPTLMETSKLKAEYVKFPSGSKAGGVYFWYSQLIRIDTPDALSSTYDKCMQVHFTLGHELLHFVGNTYLQDKYDGHQNQLLFKNDNRDSVEDKIWEDCNRACKL